MSVCTCIDIPYLYPHSIKNYRISTCFGDTYLEISPRYVRGWLRGQNYVRVLAAAQLLTLPYILWQQHVVHLMWTPKAVPHLRLRSSRLGSQVRSLRTRRSQTEYELLVGDRALAERQDNCVCVCHVCHAKKYVRSGCREWRYDGCFVIVF